MTGMVLTGGCLCEACRYEIDGPLEPAGICHCADCRRVSGSAFGVSFRTERNRFRLSGQPASFTKPADSGMRLTRHFCSACGSPLYTESPAHPDTVYVKAGSLDDASQVHVEREAWTQSKVAWAEVPADITSYSKGR